MPTVADLAKEMGVDISTLNPQFVQRLDTFHAEATTLKTDAEKNLRKAQDEYQQINDYIQKYGASEATNVSLQARTAALESAIAKLKDQGITVDLTGVPEAPKVTPKNSATAISSDVDAKIGTLGTAMADYVFANNQHMALFGKPLAQDPETLWNEARTSKVRLRDHIATKFDFAGAEKRSQEAAQKAHDDKIAAEAVEKYKTEHPSQGPNPEFQRGVDSRYSQIVKPKEAKDVRDFGKLSTREKIAQSVARTRQLIAANQ